MLNNDIFFQISLFSPSIYRNLQLASKSFWQYIKNLTEAKREEIKLSFCKPFNGLGLDASPCHGMMIYENRLPNGQLHGIRKMTIISSNRLFSVASYYHGHLHGRCETYYYASDKIRYVSHYDDGLLHGLYEIYYPSGQLEEKTTYVNGRLSGSFQKYYENGKLKAEDVNYPIS